MANNTFKASYSVLQTHAQTLRTQKEPNIDDLLTIVTESVAAYKVCQERITAVESALERALSDTTAPSAMPKAAVRGVSTSVTPEALLFDPSGVPF